MVGTILVLAIILTVIAVNFRNGVWGNATRMICTITAALIATNFFEPLGAKFESVLPTFWHYGDFIAAWLIFSITLGGLIYLSMKASFINVRFPKNLDQIGGLIFAAATGWVLVCFAAMTLHIAPIVREPLGGGFKAEEPMFQGLYPDRMWLAFAQHCSLGTYAIAPGHEFDPKGDFLLRAAAKRDRFESDPGNFTQRQVIGAGS
jgi:uncharacterized membrane protein required for colicin V production